ncbi:RNA polymerase sigma factor [Chitinophaga tropicalis]|uniref:RNA polymerase sigma-70 factor n=1 Tax=Chitinophaga tropicalis TaxID=2683588 RepID=A0A7K1U5H6_9BACT|nr:RNA polymerase sigma-70 factor [Chitinophaga tropicalis]MVT09600.1 RNA polymerase sigma-70 factor [Chitinophaga tropicalis]
MDTITNTEQALLNGLKQGDHASFARLYDLYSERLYGNLLKLVKHAETAEELLQDIFIQVWEKRHTIEIHTSFRAYLFRIGENKVYDFYRKLRRDKALYAYVKAAASEQYTHIEESLLYRENAELLQNAIATLPPQRRQIFELCKIQGKSYQEVSALLGISTSTINDHIVKATRSIRQHFYSNDHTAGALLLLAALMAGK